MTRSRELFGAGLAVVLFAASAAAFQVEETKTSLGWQAENADLVAVVEVRSREESTARGRTTVAVDLAVEEVLRGAEDTPGLLRAAWREGTGPELAEGRRALVFLTAGPDGEGWVPTGGPFAAVPLSAANEKAVLGFVGEHVSLAGGDAAKMRDHLVRGTASADARIVDSAALDLARLPDVATGASAAEVATVVRAFRAAPDVSRAKRLLAVALGTTKSPAAVPALAEALVSGRVSVHRASIGNALGRIGSKEAIPLLAPGLSSGDAAIRADAANGLGRLGLGDAVPVLARALRDPASEVKVEAALGLGRTARAVRARDEGTIDAVDALEDALKTADLRAGMAILWAAAQIDTQDGYDVVRDARANHPDPALRRFAERVLANPRRQIVLPPAR